MHEKIMLITGTSKGIGKFLAEYYARKGFQVIGCSRKPVDFEFENYRHFICDVSDESTVKEVYSYIRKSFKRLDVVINNAGIASMNHSMLTPVDTARKILDTNVIGTFLISREAAKLMKQNNYGRIINFTSFAVPFKLAGEAVYAASKAAVVSLTEILCKEYADFGITVNAIAPPAVKTDLIKGVPEDKLNNLLMRQAVHKFGKFEEISDLIDFIIKPESYMLTGQIIYLGGV